MSDNDLRNLYESVRRGEEYVAPIRQSELYKHIYVESKNNPNAAGDENTITVFFSKDPAIIEQLHAIEGIEAREMSLKYFEAGVLGRLDEQMSKIVAKLVRRAVGKKDPVAIRGIYDIFQRHHITGKSSKLLLDRLSDASESNNISGDKLVQAFVGVKTSSVVDIIPVIAENCAQYGLTASRDINSFIRELWDVKDVEGRTSVGKGELAMSCLSVCRKGEPGDIKAGADENHYTKLIVGDVDQPRLAVEVKGSGGRPGTDAYGRNWFVKDAIKMLDKLPKPTPEELKNVQYTQEQLTAADSATGAAFGNNGIAAQKQKIIDAIAGKGVDETTIQNISNLLDTATNSAEYRKNLKVYEQYFSNGPMRKISGLIDHNSKGNEASIAKMNDYKNSILADGASTLKGLDFRMGVTTFFQSVLPTLATPLPAENVAELIWSMRTEGQISLPDELKNTLINMYTSGELKVTNEATLKKLVGAIQMTSYCGHDGFTHAMFVNDDREKGNPDKRSLIIKTSKDDLNQTFLNIFSAFQNNPVDCPLSIDKQNKGVQIIFTG